MRQTANNRRQQRRAKNRKDESDGRGPHSVYFKSL
jgi:hypothetical protein